MADIYRNSVVTITATASLSVKTGILGPRKTHPACRLPWQVPKVDLMKSLPGDAISQHELVDQEVYISLDRKPWDDFRARQTCHWASRGWTMQEEFLASRILSYSSLQMSWERSTRRQVEAVSPSPGMGNAHIFRQLKSIQKKASSGPHLEIRPQLTADNGEASEDEDGDDYVDPRSFWCHILTLYSQRNLSYVQDRLPAIENLVRRVQIELGDTYYAGLWRNGLMRGLLWYSVDDKGEISSEYIGPSWSWVPVDSNLVK